jgi:hypothetical protein
LEEEAIFGAYGEPGSPPPPTSTSATIWGAGIT